MSSINIPPGPDQARAQQLAERQFQLRRLITSGEVGFTSTRIMTPRGVFKLDNGDLEQVSDDVLGVVHGESDDLLVVDCSGNEGFRNPHFVAETLAFILDKRHNSTSAKRWPGTLVTSYAPKPIRKRGPDMRQPGEIRTYDKHLAQLRTQPDLVTPLLYSKPV